ILELRDLDLDAPFLRARVAREDVEDHGGPIDDATARELLEAALLPRRELVIADDEVGPESPTFGHDLRGLPLPHPGVRVGRAPLLHDATGDDRARGLDERGELVEGIVGVE